MSARPVHLLVFRDGARPASGRALKSALARQIQVLQNSFQSEEILRALLRAGALECAVADAPADCPQLQQVTDGLAAALVNSRPVPDSRNLLALLDATPFPERLSVSAPEGFAYYALHPLAYSDVLEQLPEMPSRAVVVGIRSIGTTLSAMAAAGLQARGVASARITVRPAGHPYNRHTEFSIEQTNFVRGEIASGASFLIVDEGPGLSGSSFLSVAEALLRTGVPGEKIILICSHAPLPEQMCAENSAARWQQFRWIATSQEARRPAGVDIWIGAGEWRRFFLPDESCWPECWPSFERVKYLSQNAAEQRFYKFLGFGHYGDEIFTREDTVAAAGFGLAPRIENYGFASYPLVKARLMSGGNLTREATERLAHYCAFRLRSFGITSADLGPLQEMTEHNLAQLRLDLPVKLRLERPVIVDGHMQPHEWLLTRDGKMLKTDSGSHGDDHFFPGPTDIAWDLAGTMVEWQMNAEQAESFLDAYQRASGDKAQERIADYINAYTTFRWAYCTMAANALEGSEEQFRLELCAERYREMLKESVSPRLRSMAL